MSILEDKLSVELLERLADQVRIARKNWRETLLNVLLDAMELIPHLDRQSEFWKREFYKQEARATRAEKLVHMITQTAKNRLARVHDLEKELKAWEDSFPP